MRIMVKHPAEDCDEKWHMNSVKPFRTKAVRYAFKAIKFVTHSQKYQWHIFSVSRLKKNYMHAEQKFS